jgi:hypothetical protein
VIFNLTIYSLQAACGHPTNKLALAFFIARKSQKKKHPKKAASRRKMNK